jgi:hypothetical protein
LGSSLVALDEVPLPLPLGVAVVPLGWSALEPELELGELALGELALVSLELLDVAPPDAALSFAVSVLAELELDAPGLDGVLALGEVELELELLGGVLGVDDALLLEPEAGVLEVLSPRSWPQAARPSANATAIANVETLMCSSKVGTKG